MKILCCLFMMAMSGCYVSIKDVGDGGNAYVECSAFIAIHKCDNIRAVRLK